MDTTTPSHIVGLGASAGGVRALEQFFGNLPERSGMAFIVVQHLPAGYQSRMGDVLRRCTRLAIRTMVDGERLAADTIYLLPSKQQALVIDGCIRLRELLPHILPIDPFFVSLAQAAGERAIAVILSGSGCDGAAGLRAIRAAHGLILAQAPESARFDDMPRAALATGLVDFELPPYRMPALLMDYVAAPDELPARQAPDHRKEDYADILDQLRQSSGLDFSIYSHAAVEGTVQQRMQLTHQRQIAAYAARLRSDPAECAALCAALQGRPPTLLHPPAAFTGLEQQGLPRLFQTGSTALRIWSCGRGTGEEAISLALLLREEADCRGFAGKIEIFVSDLLRPDLVALTIGGFAAEALAMLDESRRERHFIRDADGCYRAQPELRRMLVPVLHNPASDPPLIGLDLICCWEAWDDLRPNLQGLLITRFRTALRQDGLLCLGEQVEPRPLAGFEVIDHTGGLFRKQGKILTKHDLWTRSFLEPEST